MSLKQTRTTRNLKLTSINSLFLPTKKEKQQLSIMEDIETDNIQSLQQTTDLKTDDTTSIELLNGQLLGHDLHDQRLSQHKKQQDPSILTQLRTIKKFDGQGDVEDWLEKVLEKFSELQLTTSEQNDLIPELLNGKAFIWYMKAQEKMSTFALFAKNLLQHYERKELNQDQIPSLSIKPETLVVQQAVINSKDNIIDSLRNQMMIMNLEKLPKFNGKLKQNPSNWLQDIEEQMNLFKLTNEEKLSVISLCLEAEARDWFYDNKHLILTWTTFTQKLIKIFGCTGKADVAFNRLRHYEQGINQDVRQYYLEIMKLCKEANSSINDDTRLQYLKDGLKPSLRFDVLLKNPSSPEEFLEYAQKVEQLKSLENRQSINASQINQQQQQPNYHDEHRINNNNIKYNNSTQQMKPNTSSTNQYYHQTPAQPYQCYKCGAHDHFIRNCPSFQ
ncbi:unnamed protein product [Rotaria socialis]|uniref:CCHC-type domain-containing protein n=2 Tax=Rotaria socialis TaxID=392032 RepID=A0A821SXD9_9BILA|nr:unnamed protein product [Rotaria socialis]